MNTKQKTIIIAYYVLLIFVVGFSALDVVTQTSKLITHGSKVRQLQYDKNQLLENSKSISNQITYYYSISALDKKELAEYHPITHPIVLSGTVNVALR